MAGVNQSTSLPKKSNYARLSPHKARDYPGVCPLVPYTPPSCAPIWVPSKPRSRGAAEPGASRQPLRKATTRPFSRGSMAESRHTIRGACARAAKAKATDLEVSLGSALGTFSRGTEKQNAGPAPVVWIAKQTGANTRLWVLLFVCCPFRINPHNQRKGHESRIAAGGDLFSWQNMRN